MKTLKNAVAALEIIADSHGPVPVAQIGKRLGLPRSSASRLMASLRDGGLVEQDTQSRRYVAGQLAWRLGVGHHPTGYDSALIADCLLSITTKTGFTSWMAVLSGTNIVLLRQNQGTAPVQFSVRLGQTLPAHATAIGKAILSRLPERTVLSLYGEPMPQLTEHTIVDPVKLIAELDVIRLRKVSFSRQEAFPGVIAVGGAIFGSISNCPIGVSISFPAAMGQSDEIAELLCTELARIGRLSGDVFWNDAKDTASASSD